MTAFGSIAMQLSREQVITALEETFAGIRGIKACTAAEIPIGRY
jgi:hypothetical protein